MTSEPRQFFEFDEFRIDVRERRLLRNDRMVTLASRDFDILLALVERAGQTVDKNDLMEIVWENTFVEEGNLNRHVSTLRKVLGDDPREQRLIKTIPKRGYRFTANIRETIESSERVGVENLSRARLVIKEETSEGFWTATRFAVVCVILAGLGVLGFFVLGGGTSIRGSGIEGLEGSGRRAAATDLFRRGRQLWQTRKAGDLHNATLLLEQARETDPDFALARAALADAYAFDYANWRKAEPEAREAMRLDATLAEPHATVGFVRMFWEWKVAEAEDSFKTALNLNPGYATARQWYALNLAAAGRGDAAVVEIQKAAALEPGSVPIRIDRCRLLYFAKAYQLAIDQCKQALQLDPASTEAQDLLYRIYATNEMFDEAVDLFVHLTANSKDEEIRKAADDLRDAYSREGISGFRRKQLWFYSDIDGGSYYRLARILAESGDIETAVARLNEAVARRDFEMIFFAVDPAFEAVRTGPRNLVISGRPM